MVKRQKEIAPPPVRSRRVYRPEILERAHWSHTTLYARIERGVFAQGRIDPGGARRWWTEEEVHQGLMGEWRPPKVPVPEPPEMIAIRERLRRAAAARLAKKAKATKPTRRRTPPPPEKEAA